MNTGKFSCQQANAQQTTVTEAISQAVANSALDLDAKAIITSTESGYTARMVSKYRPKAPIIAVTPVEHVMRSLQLVWGVIPVLGKPAETTDEMFDIAVNGAVESGLVKLGDTVIITAGVPVGRSGSTNLIKIHTVGEIDRQGPGRSAAIARPARSSSRARRKKRSPKRRKASILVTPSTEPRIHAGHRESGGADHRAGRHYEPRGRRRPEPRHPGHPRRVRATGNDVRTGWK